MGFKVFFTLRVFFDESFDYQYVFIILNLMLLTSGKFFIVCDLFLDIIDALLYGITMFLKEIESMAVSYTHLTLPTTPYV